MQEIYIDENGKVELRDITIRKVTTVESLIASFKDVRGLNTGMLPRNCVIYSKNANKEHYVIETLPGIKYINYRSIDGISFNRTPVSLPFLYWCFKSNPGLSVLVRCTKTKVRSLDDPIFISPLLNIHGSGERDMCTGNAISINALDPNHVKINDFMNQIWESIWQHDLTPRLPNGFENYIQYIEESARNPALWSEVNYHSVNETFGSWITRLGIQGE